MKNLSFNEGYESFTVNGDTSRVIRFNPADPEIINRLLHLQKEFTDYQMSADVELNPDGTPKEGIEKDAAYLEEFTNKMKGAINGVFNADVYDTIFNGQSPLCIVGPKGKEQYLFEAVLGGMAELMKPYVDDYNKKHQKKMGKYLGDMK